MPRKYKVSQGMKSFMGGNIYQLKLLMLFLKKGLYLKYNFHLGTEVSEAGSFDDIVFQYEKEGKKLCRFVQAKHTANKDKRVTYGDLINEQDGNFSLQKYFNSYCKIIKSKEFEGYDLKDFVLCTNANLDSSVMDFVKKAEKDDFFESTYKFDRERMKQVKAKLQDSTDLFKLTKELVDFSLGKKRILQSMKLSIHTNWHYRKKSLISNKENFMVSF